MSGVNEINNKNQDKANFKLIIQKESGVQINN